MRELDREIRLLLEKVQRKRQLEVMLEAQHHRRQELEQRASRLKVIMEREQADVDRLEGRSLAALFYSIVGRMEEKLTREREEAYAARIQYEGTARELAALEAELERKTAELQSLEGCQEAYQKLLQEKAELLKKLGGPAAENLLALENRLSVLTHQGKELEEAIAAGLRARKQADRVLSSLDDAQGWATWDVLGGDVFSDMAKYSKLDQAQSGLEQLQICLQSFKTELADVTIQADVQIRVEGFLQFADVFFDNIFSDWTVMEHINSSQEQVSRTRTQISTVLQILQQTQFRNRQEWTDLRERLEETVRDCGIPKDR